MGKIIVPQASMFEQLTNIVAAQANRIATAEVMLMGLTFEAQKRQKFLPKLRREVELTRKTLVPSAMIHEGLKQMLKLIDTFTTFMESESGQADKAPTERPKADGGEREKGPKGRIAAVKDGQEARQDSGACERGVGKAQGRPKGKVARQKEE